MTGGLFAPDQQLAADALKAARRPHRLNEEDRAFVRVLLLGIVRVWGFLLWFYLVGWYWELGWRIVRAASCGRWTS